MRYSLVGLVNTLFYTVLLFFFISFLELPRAFSVGLAFAVAMSFQYMANRLFTFRSTKKVSSELPRYLAAALINYVVTLFVLSVVIDFFKWSEGWASICAGLITAITGYSLALLWVFSDEK